MFCLRTSRAAVAALRPSVMARAVQAPIAQSARAFSSITPLRPSIFPSTLSAFRTPSLTTPATTTVSSTGAIIDVLPKISSNPGLAGIQIRCGPRDTYDPSHLVRKRRHGFLARLRTRKGRATLKRRKAKGRKSLSH